MNENEKVKDFIEHHGVKGMRWGVRRSKAAIKRSAESKRVSELRARPKQSLTNKQLRIVNERLNLEQQFSRLNPTTVAIGHNAVRNTLAIVGTAATLYNIVNSPAGKAAVAAGKKFIGKIKHSHMEVGVDFIKHRNSLLLRPIS